MRQHHSQPMKCHRFAGTHETKKRLQLLLARFVAMRGLP